MKIEECRIGIKVRWNPVLLENSEHPRLHDDIPVDAIFEIRRLNGESITFHHHGMPYTMRAKWFVPV